MVDKQLTMLNKLLMSFYNGLAILYANHLSIVWRLKNIPYMHKRMAPHSWQYHNRRIDPTNHYLPEMVLCVFQLPKTHKQILVNQSIV